MIIAIHERIHAIDPSHPVPEEKVVVETAQSGAAKSVFRGLLIAGMSILIFGAFMFIALDEVRYFSEYMMLSGYYSAINTLFTFDYLLIAVGAIGTLATAKSNGRTSVASILGVLGCVFAWLFALVGHGLSIAGIIVGAKEAKETGYKGTLAVCILAEVCAFFSSLIGIISTLIY